jgi:O-acetyl-ADP-ribose deacetylase (regulator of RNase III)
MPQDRIELKKGDITKINTDAIVNAANKTLTGGGGVDGAIHKAAGPELLEAAKKLNGCETGDAKITKGFNLPAKYVIHAVGPYYTNGQRDDDALLESAYNKSLFLAAQHGAKTIAFPNISTGVYKFPKKRAAEIAISTVRNFLKENTELEKVIFVTFDDENYQIYKKMLSE